MRWTFVAASAGLAFGCTNPSDGKHDPVGTPVSPSHPLGSGAGFGSGSGSGSVATCPSAAAGTFVSPTNITGGTSVATDARGDVFYTATTGIRELDSSGNLVFLYPYGSQLAIDASGNIFVAGAFTTPTDFGLGTIQPMGNIDVFVVKLDPTGHAVFTVDTGLCGDGVDSLAVDRAGRIAMSGSAMGTAVLDATGDLMFDVAVAGQVALDSKGDVFVAGSFTGSLDLGGGNVLTAASTTDVDGFVVELDPTGAYVASAQLGDVQLAAGAQPAAQVVASIAIDAGDNVALFGTFAGEIDLFGQPQQAASEGPSGSLLGLFVAKLDSSQSVVFAETMGSQYANNPAGTIAVDPAGNVLVSTNAAADLSLPYAYPQLYRLDANTGAMLPGGFTQTTNNPLGYGLGVAVDACGNIQWADSEQVASLAPLQPMLRTVAE